MVTGNTYKVLEKQFKETIQKTVNIVTIQEVCNIDEYDRYER